MAIYQPESFYETTLATSITATASTIAVTTAPNITSGYLVLEANTSNREIIKYTGVTGTNLTGCVRGLAEYGSDDSAGTGTTHSAGIQVANKDVHYYYAQYYDFLTGVSATGSNKMMIGDGGAVSSVSTGRFWYACTSSVSAFWGLSANGALVISEDGTTSWTISAGGSGVTAGDGITIGAGVVDISHLSSSGLRISANKLAVNPGQGLSTTSAAELYVDLTHDYNWAGLNTFQSSCVFESSGSMEVNSDVAFGGSVVGMDLVEYYDADEVIAVSVNPKAVKLTSAGRVYMVSTDAVGTVDPIVGFAITASSAAGTQVNVQTGGIVNGFTGLAPTSSYYVAGPAGEISITQGTIIQEMGIAKTDTQLLFKPVDITTDSGSMTTVQANGTNTTDRAITTRFKPRYIQLFYFAQGYDGGTSQYFATTGLVMHKGTTNIWNLTFAGGATAGDNSAITHASVGIGKPNATTTMAAGQSDSGTYPGVKMTITILSVDKSGFTIRCQTTQAPAGAAGSARAYVDYIAYR